MNITQSAGDTSVSHPIIATYDRLRKIQRWIFLYQAKMRIFAWFFFSCRNILFGVFRAEIFILWCIVQKILVRYRYMLHGHHNLLFGFDQCLWNASLSHGKMLEPNCLCSKADNWVFHTKIRIGSRMLNCKHILEIVPPPPLRARQGPKTTIKVDNSPKCLAHKSG